MPIAGPPNDNIVPADPNLRLSDYSHSTVVTVNLPSVTTHNVPPLLKIYTPPVECLNRWILLDRERTDTLGMTTFIVTSPMVGGTTTRLVAEAQPITPTYSIGPFGTSSQIVARALAGRQAIRTFEVVQPASYTGSVSVRNTEPLPFTQAFNLTVWSIHSDPLFTSCQPYSSMPLYSPGVCPDGHTAAEITEVHANFTAGGVSTSWVASCCKSGMTFGANVQRFCISTISTPFTAHAVVTQSIPTIINNNSTFIYKSGFEYVTSSFVGTTSGGSGNGYTTYTVSNITTITSALAVAVPVVVAWAVEDISSFPAPYATSIANKIGASLAPRVQDVPALPSETAIAPVTQELSPAAKAGIGVSSVLGAALIVTVIVLLWMKSQRQAASTRRANPEISEMEDHDGNLAKRKWYLGGRWRSEAETEAGRQELDSKTVHVVPGPPAELEALDTLRDESDEQSVER